MPPNPTDPLDVVRRLAEVHRSVKLGSGVVGKTSYVTIALIGLWTTIIIRLSAELWLNVALLVAGFVATGVYFWWVKRTQEFAERNPGLAILEGAQLIEYQKWDAEIKGIGLLARGQITDDPQGERQQ